MHLKIIIIMILLAAAAAGPAVSGELSFDPDTAAVFTDDTFMINIMVEDQDSIMGYDLTVSFDQELLYPEDVLEGGLPIGSGRDTFFRWMNEGASDGTVTVNGSILGGTVDGPGVLLTIVFKALAAGISPLEFTGCRMRNGLNEDLPLNFDGGYVRIMAPVATDQSTWGAIKKAGGAGESR